MLPQPPGLADPSVKRGWEWGDVTTAEPVHRRHSYTRMAPNPPTPLQQDGPQTNSLQPVKLPSEARTVPGTRRGQLLPSVFHLSCPISPQTFQHQAPAPSLPSITLGSVSQGHNSKLKKKEQISPARSQNISLFSAAFANGLGYRKHKLFFGIE